MLKKYPMSLYLVWIIILIVMPLPLIILLNNGLVDSTRSLLIYDAGVVAYTWWLGIIFLATRPRVAGNVFCSWDGWSSGFDCRYNSRTAFILNACHYSKHRSYCLVLSNFWSRLCSIILMPRYLMVWELKVNKLISLKAKLING